MKFSSEKATSLKGTITGERLGAHVANVTTFESAVIERKRSNNRVSFSFLVFNLNDEYLVY